MKHVKSSICFLFAIHGVLFTATAGETLYNGIELPEQWPPRIRGHAGQPPLKVWEKPGDPPSPRYLDKPPAVIPIDVGRQLFVDDFLIESTTLSRVWHKPVKHPGNPILKPERPWEMGRGVTPMAAPFSDGCFYDPMTKQFMLWYSAGWYDSTALAVSKDGVNWKRPAFGFFEDGDNLVMLKDQPLWRRDTVSVWLDHHASDPAERFKATMFCRTGEVGGKVDSYNPGQLLLASPDGVHWTIRGQTKHSKDNTTMFYNPFRKKWVLSHRIHIKHDDGRYERARAYWETDDLFSAAAEDAYEKEPPVFWSCIDALDLAGHRESLKTATPESRPDIELGNSNLPQVYKIDATPYESLMVGLFEILTGPTNTECARQGIPKTTGLQIAFSRDGFHWDRHRETFIGCTRKPGSWERGYISSCGGGCLVVGDELWFYYGAFKGDPTNTTEYYVWGGIYANGATGLAKLRRDGFASMDAGKNEGVLTTRPVMFSGEHLFVNLAATEGELRVELLDRNNNTIAPFTLDNCRPVTGDSASMRVAWKDADDLSQLAGQPVRFRFSLKNGSLYAFWISQDESGASNGYVAAGGPGFTGPTDTVGVGALESN